MKTRRISSFVGNEDFLLVFTAKHIKKSQSCLSIGREHKDASLVFLTTKFTKGHEVRLDHDEEKLWVMSSQLLIPIAIGMGSSC